MSDAVQLAKAAREQLSLALNALQTNAHVPEELLSVAEPIAQAMSVLHRIERSNGADLEGREQALASVRQALEKTQAVSAHHPAIEVVMDAVANSLSKMHALSRYQPPAPMAVAAPQPAPVAVAPAPQPVAAPAPMQSGGTMPLQPAPFNSAGYGAQPQAYAPQPAPSGYAAQPPAYSAQPQGYAPQQPAPVGYAAQPQAYAPQPAPQPAPAAHPQHAQAYAPQPAPVAHAHQQPQAYAPQPQGYAPAPQPLAAQAAHAPQPAAAAQPRAQAERAPQAQAAAPAPAPAAAPSAKFAPAGPVIDVELGTHSASNFYKGLGGNDVIEHGGVFVATYKVPKIGSMVSLQVHMPGSYEFTANASVQWTREAGDSEPGFGARFTQISAEGKQLVYRYTRNREPMFYDDL